MTFLSPDKLFKVRRVLISNLATMQHPTLKLAFLAQYPRVTHILQIYSYKVTYIPPVCAQSSHYLCWDQNHFVVTKRAPWKGCMQEQYDNPIQLERISTPVCARLCQICFSRGVERLKIVISECSLAWVPIPLPLQCCFPLNLFVSIWVTQQDLGPDEALALL